jgi:chemotaxis signal transduction protein
MRLSTRIIVVGASKIDEGTELLGLIAERVTDISERPPLAFASKSVCRQKIPYFGGVVMDKDKMIQLIDVDALFKTLQDTSSQQD